MLKGFIFIVLLGLVAADCLDKPTLQNANLTCVRRKSKEVCTTKCKEGYRTVEHKHKSKSECHDLDTEWSRPILDCHDCRRIKYGDNRRQNCSQVEMTGQVQCSFTCDENYLLHGPEMITCADGAWDLVPPFCKQYPLEDTLGASKLKYTNDEWSLLDKYYLQLSDEDRDMIDILDAKLAEQENNRSPGVRTPKCYPLFCKRHTCQSIRTGGKMKLFRKCMKCLNIPKFRAFCDENYSSKTATFFGR